MIQQVKLHPDFVEAKKRIYDQMGWIVKNIQPETESQEYGACDFEMNNSFIKFRVAKITPTKVGQFVTLWKRIGNGPIMPYDIADPIDLFVINVRSKNHFGQFVFPKAVLSEKGIISKNGISGKRAMRVYPAWDVTDNPQAKRTQAWQLNYFFEINPDQPMVSSILEKLFI